MLPVLQVADAEDWQVSPGYPVTVIRPKRVCDFLIASSDEVAFQSGIAQSQSSIALGGVELLTRTCAYRYVS